MFLNIHIDLIILKTHDQQFTLTTKKSLHIIFKAGAARMAGAWFTHCGCGRCVVYKDGSITGTSQLFTRSTRHTIKLCDELTIVSDGIVTS